MQGGASASKAAQRTPWGISKASSSSGEFRLDARTDFLYFQRLNLCSDTAHQAMMARHLRKKITPRIYLNVTKMYKLINWKALQVVY